MLLAALAGVALIGLPGSPAQIKLRQGLDLQGGLEVVLQAKPAKGHVVTSSEMSNAISVMRQRVDKLGVAEPEITKQGTDQIVIQLPAVDDPAEAAKVIGKTAQLELFDLTPSLIGPSIDAAQNAVAKTSLFDLLNLVQSGHPGTPTAYSLFVSRSKKLVAGPETTLAALQRAVRIKGLKAVQPKTVTVKPTKKGAKPTTKVIPPGKTTEGFPTGYQVLKVPARMIVVTCDSKVAQVCPGVGLSLIHISEPTRPY